MEKVPEANALKNLTPGQIYWKLFTITFSLSACTFGGGFVIISMMRTKVVEELVAQSSPGALGVNIAIVVGYRLKKAAGAVICTLGAILPPLIIISIISVFYNQFRDNAYIAVALQVMRAGVAAVIFDVVLGLAGNIFRTKSILWIGLMAAAFAATCFFNVSAVVIILICGTVGLLQIKHEERKEERL